MGTNYPSIAGSNELAGVSLTANPPMDEDGTSIDISLYYPALKYTTYTNDLTGALESSEKELEWKTSVHDDLIISTSNSNVTVQKSGPGIIIKRNNSNSSVVTVVVKPQLLAKSFNDIKVTISIPQYYD